MHCLDVDLDVLVEIPAGPEVFETFTGCKRCHPAVVDAHHVRRCRREFAPIVRNVCIRNHRPGIRVRGRFASEIAGVELFEGGVDVVGVERRRRPTSRSSASISMITQDAVSERLGPIVSSREE